MNVSGEADGPVAAIAALEVARAVGPPS